MKKMYLHLKD
ncbi:hypothetical protein MACK_003274 [Theileria orientalis]|uniref:Uncharacterized protein n=1 Tax=Theileria orientalis TaxID=68886 RepID=A0A976XIB2_THEOR|nr:hypothetical protein MACK_003274 [Theileria orientalis]